jgi:hypothetical protein
MQQHDIAYFRDRAEREISIAKATGAKAHASADYRKIFIKRPDGTQETLRIPQPREQRN